MLSCSNHRTPYQWYLIEAKGDRRNRRYRYVGNSYLSLRVDALRRAQNPDGGWGYFPGKRSWLEPTFYAALVLHGDAAADKAWALLSSWQRRDGSWRPSADVEISHSSSALCVTMASLRGEYGDPFHKGVGWLLKTEGMESGLTRRFIVGVGSLLGMIEDQRNLSLEGWPWKPGTASWVEPTTHALVALKKAALKIPSSGLRKRVKSGEALLLDVRCRDGGWNYGNRTARGEELRSYPETTALALVGLQGRSEIGPALDLGAKMLGETSSPLARAWLGIALRVNGAPVVSPAIAGESCEDLLLTALEALAAPEGNHQFLKTEEAV
jgi:hypothetical protein